LGVSLTTLKQLIRAGHLIVSQPAGIRRVFIKGSSILEMLERTTLSRAASNQAIGKTAFLNKPTLAFASPHTMRLDAGSSARWNQRGQDDALALRATGGTPSHQVAAPVGIGAKIPRTRGGASR
jgi:hypothetical protein